MHFSKCHQYYSITSKNYNKRSISSNCSHQAKILSVKCSFVRYQILQRRRKQSQLTLSASSASCLHISHEDANKWFHQCRSDARQGRSPTMWTFDHSACWSVNATSQQNWQRIYLYLLYVHLSMFIQFIS